MNYRLKILPVIDQAAIQRIIDDDTWLKQALEEERQQLIIEDDYETEVRSETGDTSNDHQDYRPGSLPDG
jgi:hypothetical protein